MHAGPASRAPRPIATSRAVSPTCSSRPSTSPAPSLTEGLETDADVPLEERFARNVGRFIDHALEPSDAWRVHRHGRSAGMDDVEVIARRYRGLIISAISQNHFGTPDPPPYGHLAIRAWLDFAETALDECREEKLQRDSVVELLGRTLFDAVDSARRLDSR